MPPIAEGSRAGQAGGLRGTTRLLTVAVMCTIGALLWFGTSTLLANWALRQEYVGSRLVERLRGEIVYLDEALTMSALMAAATGEPRWSARFERHRVQLEQALEQATSMAPTHEKSGAANATGKANEALVTMEEEALRHVREGRLDAAQGILNSDTYQQQKQAYAESIRRFALSRRRDAQLDRLRGAIIYHDEVLTMCAHMAAATGELKWEARFQSYRKRLEEALFDVGELSEDPRAASAIRVTDRANEQLLSMEERTFELVRNGQAAAAKELLDSEPYGDAKQRYAAGMRDLADILRQEADRILADEARAAWLRTLAAVGLVLLLLLGWLFVTLRVRASQHALAETGAALLEKTEQLSADIEAREKVERDLRESMDHLQKTQEELLQSRKLAALGGMAAGVAHEINNPLSGVMGISSLLLARPSRQREPAELRKDLETIQRSAERCRDIVAKLLAFAHRSGGERAWLSVAEAVDETLRLVAAKVGGRGVELVADVQPGLRVWANATELHQILINIVANAADAVSEGGRVEVRGSETAEGGVSLRVQDDGPGIAQEHLGRIFDPFFTTKSVGEGTGLGLSVVHGLVQDHGGEIRVDATGASGTTFAIELPPGPEGAGTGTDARALDEGKAEQRRVRVLVLDDDELVREVVQQMVEEPEDDAFACEARGAASPRAALELLQREHWDLLITDFRMDGQDGLEVARLAKQASPDLRVVLMSGHGGHLDAANSQVDAVLAKPPGIRDVHSAIRRALSPAAE